VSFYLLIPPTTNLPFLHLSALDTLAVAASSRHGSTNILTPPSPSFQILIHPDFLSYSFVPPSTYQFGHDRLPEEVGICQTQLTQVLFYSILLPCLYGYHRAMIFPPTVVLPSSSALFHLDSCRTNSLANSARLVRDMSDNMDHRESPTVIAIGTLLRNYTIVLIISPILSWPTFLLFCETKPVGLPLFSNDSPDRHDNITDNLE